MFLLHTLRPAKELLYRGGGGGGGLRAIAREKILRRVFDVTRFLCQKSSEGHSCIKLKPFPPPLPEKKLINFFKILIKKYIFVI